MSAAILISIPLVPWTVSVVASKTNQSVKSGRTGGWIDSTTVIRSTHCLFASIAFFVFHWLCQDPGLFFVGTWGRPEMTGLGSDSYRERQRGLRIRDWSWAFENVQNWELLQKSLLTHTFNRMFAFQQRVTNVTVDYVAPLICYWFSNTEVITSIRENSC